MHPCRSLDQTYTHTHTHKVERKTDQINSFMFLFLLNYSIFFMYSFWELKYKIKAQIKFFFMKIIIYCHLCYKQ